MYTIVLNKNKQLVTTIRETIFQNENRVNTLRFLIDTSAFEPNLSQFNVILQAKLPNGLEGRLQYLTFEEALYKDRFLVAKLPITKTLTKDEGELILRLSFFYEDADGLYYSLNTDSASVEILGSDMGSEHLEPESETNLLANLQKQIDELNQSKVGFIEYDKDTNTIHMYADETREELIGSTVIDNDVEWKEGVE